MTKQNDKCCKFIVIVPIINIAEQFCDRLVIEIRAGNESMMTYITPCVRDGEFKQCKTQMKDSIEAILLIVMTYSTSVSVWVK